METSPLRLLDNDVSQMLCEQVRISREEEARRFHDNLFNYGEKLNVRGHHDYHIFNYANIEYMQNLFSKHV